MSDRETLSVYDAQAAAYAEAFGDPAPRDLQDFAARLPARGRVLDWGCGPGTMAGWLAAQGFVVEAWDGSAEMVRLASAQPGVTARQAMFDDLVAEAAYDGIWASFALLHARRGDIPALIGRMARALKPQGVAYVAMKLGTGEARDRLGRHYAYVSEAELQGWLQEAGLMLLTTRHGHAKGLAGTDDPYITMTAEKAAAGQGDG